MSATLAWTVAGCATFAEHVNVCVHNRDAVLDGEGRMVRRGHARFELITTLLVCARQKLILAGAQALQSPPGASCEMLIKTWPNVMTQSSTQPLFCCAAIIS